MVRPSGNHRLIWIVAYTLLSMVAALALTYLYFLRMVRPLEPNLSGSEARRTHCSVLFHRTQVSVEPGEGFLDELVPETDMVGFVQFELLVLGWSS